jgi:hypothetical protein
VLSLLDSARVKMSQVEELIGDRLEEEGRVLAEVVAEHVLMCFQSREPHVSLEPVVQGPTEETGDVALAGVHDIMRLVATQFEHQHEDA